METKIHFQMRWTFDNTNEKIVKNGANILDKNHINANKTGHDENSGKCLSFYLHYLLYVLCDFDAESSAKMI